MYFTLYMYQILADTEGKKPLSAAPAKVPRLTNVNLLLKYPKNNPTGAFNSAKKAFGTYRKASPG